MRAILVFFLLPACLYGQNAREIVDRYLDTVSNGNVDNWNKIKSVYKESEVYYSQNDFEQKVDLLTQARFHYHKSYSVLPYNQKNEIYEDSTFSKLLSEFYFLEDQTIILMGNVPPMIKEPPARDEFEAHFLPLQITRLVDRSTSIELLGRRTFPVEGVSCYEIRITVNGRHYLLFINTVNFLLEFWNGRKDEDPSFLTRFFDYRKVDDFLMPMSDCLMRNGVVYFRNNTRKMQLNVEIGPEIFDYPGKR